MKHHVVAPSVGESITEVSKPNPVAKAADCIAGSIPKKVLCAVDS